MSIDKSEWMRLTIENPVLKFYCRSLLQRVIVDKWLLKYHTAALSLWTINFIVGVACYKQIIHGWWWRWWRQGSWKLFIQLRKWNCRVQIYLLSIKIVLWPAYKAAKASKRNGYHHLIRGILCSIWSQLNIYSLYEKIIKIYHLRCDH